MAGIPQYNWNPPDAGLGQMLMQLPNAFWGGIDRGRKMTQEATRQRMLDEAAANGPPSLQKLAEIGARTGDIGAALQALGLAEQGGMRDLQRQKLEFDINQAKTRSAREAEALQGWNSMVGGGAAPQQSGPAAPSGGAVKGYDRPEARRVYESALSRGLTPVQAAAFTGAALAESSYRTNARNPGDGSDGTDSVGLFQWNSDRARNLQRFAASQGKDWRDKDVQLAYAFEEMQGPENFAGQALRAARTPEEASAAMLHYLRPAGYTRSNPLAAGSAGARIANTNALLGIYGGQGRQPSASPVAALGLGAAPVQVAQAQPAVATDAPAPVVPAQAMQPNQRSTGGPLGHLTDQQLAASAGNQYLPETLRNLAMEELRARRQLDAERRKTEMPTELQRNFQEAKRQGYQGDIVQYQKDIRPGTTVNVDQKGETKFSETVSKAMGERVVKMVEDGDQAVIDKALVGQLRELGDQVKTGGWASFVAMAADKGVKLPGAPTVEAYGALIDRLTPQQRVPGSGATSDFDARMFKGSLPRLINSPEGNRVIVDTLDALAENRMRRAEIANLIAIGDLDRKEGFRQIGEFQKQAKALEKNVIEAAKGAVKPAQAAQGATPAGNAAPAPQGATAQPQASAPPDKAIAHLRANPQLREAFDQKYGAGASARALGQ